MIFKETKKKESRMDGLSICIWGDGPGRPYDNVYHLEKIADNNDGKVIKLYFSGNEECIIEEPSGVVLDKSHIKINSAKKITWSFYYYGKPKSKETLITTEYYLLDPKHVRVTTKGDYFNRDEIIDVSKEIAINSLK